MSERLFDHLRKTIPIEGVSHVLFWITDLQGGYFFHNDRVTVMARAQQLEDTRGLEGLIFRVFDFEKPIYSSDLPAFFKCWAQDRFAPHMNLTPDLIAGGKAAKQIMEAGCTFPLPYDPHPYIPLPVTEDIQTKLQKAAVIVHLQRECEELKAELKDEKKRIKIMTEKLSDEAFQELTQCRSCGSPFKVGTAQCPYCSMFQ